MNIGFITPEYPHPKVSHSAGLGTSVFNLAKALVALGNNIYVFVYAQKVDDHFIEDGINIFLIGSKSYHFGKWFWYRKHIQKYVQNRINTYNITILEVPDWTGISAFMKFSVPVVMRFHGSDAYFCHIEQRKQKMKNKLFEQMAINNAQGFIAPTSFAGTLSKSIFKISNHKPIETIHHGLQLERFTNKDPLSFNKNTILYIGTIIRKKGVLQLPDIFSHVKLQYPDAKLILIGRDAPDISTESRSTWELLEKKFDTNIIQDVHYLGERPYSEVKKAIKKARVCIFPSFAETLGMVTIEAMALKKPVVNSSIGWAQELIDDGVNGFLEHPSDSKAYAERIVLLLRDNELCLRIGENARIKVEDSFDINKQALKNIEFYKNILNCDYEKIY